MKARNSSILPKVDHHYRTLSDLRGSPIRSEYKRRSHRRERQQLKAALHCAIHDYVQEGTALYKEGVLHARNATPVQVAHTDTARCSEHAQLQTGNVIILLAYTGEGARLAIIHKPKHHFDLMDNASRLAA